MSHRTPWLDPTSTQVAVALAILAAIGNGVWILFDNSVPSWDQSHYLWTTLQYQHSFEIGGLRELVHSIHTVDPSHGPLFTILMLPFLYLFGPSASSGLILNLLIAPVLYFSAGEIAWIVFRSWVARLLTIALVATMPMMVGLFHNTLQDFLLVTLTALSLLLLLKSEEFQRRWMTWAMALTMGLGTLTKVTFPLFVIGPLLVVIVGIFASRFSTQGTRVRSFDGRRLALNLGGAVLVYLVVALAWYGPTFSETLDYVRSTTNGPLALGAGPSNPYTFNAITSFTAEVINSNLSWIILLAGLIAVMFNAARLKALFSHPMRWRPLQKLAFLLSWAVIPYLSVALGHNQDVRLMAPALAVVAILVAGAITALRWRGMRVALASLTVALLAYQTLNHVTDITPGFMPDQARVEVDDYVAVAQLNSEPIGYEQSPRADYGTPVIEYIEDVGGVELDGATAPQTVCLLESETIINGNSLGFLVSAREDPFVFTDVLIGPEGSKGLEMTLSGCDFALYVKPARVSPAGKNSRLELDNEPYAANYMMPRHFRLFRDPSRAFVITTSVGTNHVRVLVRIPGT